MDPAFTWDQPKPAVRRAVRRPTADPTIERITLREAEHRFGVTASTLRSWARRGSLDAVMDDSSGSRQWMVTAESVAHHLSRHPTRTPAKAKRATTPKPVKRRSTGPTPDGTAMLVPRDAWDRLIDQLGNLHETGLLLAEARERAAKAETEATFLRERLAEMRAGRESPTRTPSESGARRLLRWFSRG